MMFTEALTYVLVTHDNFLSELAVCLHPLILLCQGSASTASVREIWGNTARIFLRGRTTHWWSERSNAVVQLPATQDASEGLSVSAQQPAIAGTEVCWEPGSHGSVVRMTQALLERHMGKGRGVRKVLGSLGFS